MKKINSVHKMAKMMIYELFNKYSKYDLQFIIRLFLVFFIFTIHYTLSRYIEFNYSFLIMDIIVIVITIIIWKYDKILKLNLKIKYIVYYLSLFILSLILFPEDIFSVINILYKNGIREEILYRMFMFGIFYNYFTDVDVGSQKKFLTVIIYTNLLFTISHSYNYVGLFYIFIIGFIFTIIYYQGGLISVILAHTIHNVYRSQNETIIILLILLPLIFIFPSITNFIKKIHDNIFKALTSSCPDSKKAVRIGSYLLDRSFQAFTFLGFLFTASSKKSIDMRARNTQQKDFDLLERILSF